MKTKGYCTDVFYAQATAWMDAQRKSGKPFFAYIPSNAPHGPLLVRPEDKAVYEGQGLSENAERFFGMIHNIDQNVGKLLARLDEWGIARNTLVIFMNDNGGTAGVDVFNAGMRGTKGSAWLGGTRASSFWRWPGTLQPADCRALAAHIDFLPTLAELAGATLTAEVQRQVEGRSLVPLLEDPAAPWADRVLITHLGRWPKHSDPNLAKFKMCSVRNTRWHLVSAAGAAEPKWELFDVQADLGEKSGRGRAASRCGAGTGRRLRPLLGRGAAADGQREGSRPESESLRRTATTSSSAAAPAKPTSKGWTRTARSTRRHRRPRRARKRRSLHPEDEQTACRKQKRKLTQLGMYIAAWCSKLWGVCRGRRASDVVSQGAPLLLSRTERRPPGKANTAKRVKSERVVRRCQMISNRLNRLPRLVAVVLVVCPLLFAAVGCGTREGLATVTGTVKLDGQPLPDALVEFIPQGGKGVTSMGRTDSSGNYDVWATRTAKGASVGKNKVRVTTYDLLDQGGKVVTVREKVPTKYNSDTELEVTVENGSNTFDFDLSTAGGAVKQTKQSPLTE